VCCLSDPTFYDWGMRIGRNFFGIFVLLLVGTAVVVNFARTAPFVSLADGGADTYADFAPSGLVEENERPKCPCPTEVEKTDCDEGLCSGGLLPEQTGQSLKSGPTHHTLSFDVWRTTSAEPELAPPRAAV